MIATYLIIGASEPTLGQDRFDLGSLRILGRRHGVCDDCRGEDEGKKDGDLGELHG